jgi:transcriptional regulator with XRE-family HTH domain
LGKGLSQEKLAQKAGVTYSILTKIECGHNTNPKVMNLVKLAKALGVTVTDLLGA